MPDADAERVEAWRPPDLSGSDFSGIAKRSAPARQEVVEPLPEEPMPTLPTLEEIEQIQQQAHQEGYDQGHKEGFDYGHREALEEGRKQIAEKLAGLEQLFGALETPFKELDDQVEDELLTLVVAMVRQLVRREVRTDPNQIIGVMREALSILPVNSRDIRVLLHPEDAEIVRELYAVGDTEQSWKIIEDPVVQRGGCRVLTDISQVDATLESRLHNLIAPLIGGLRSEDPEQESS
jgi:flagellar assembly protein FliH